MSDRIARICVDSEYMTTVCWYVEHTVMECQVLSKEAMKFHAEDINSYISLSGDK
jgi:hypothetical protein